MTRLHCFVSDSVAMPGSERGPLSGRNFVAKDLFALRGRVSSFGSERWRETHAPARETADVVAALLGAGARLAGLTVMDQLAYSPIGNVGEGEPPVNPRQAAGGGALDLHGRGERGPLRPPAGHRDLGAPRCVGERESGSSGRRQMLDRCRAAAERPAAERTEDGAARVRYAESLSRLLGEKRAIVLPVVPRRIPLRTAPVEDLRDFRARTFRLTAPASLSGCPQAVVPCGDVALGLLGPRVSDPSLLRLT